MSSKDLTAILFVENQGRFANPSVKSVEAALEQAIAERGISAQFVLLADNPDEKTRMYLENHRPERAEVLITNFGSSAQALGHALKQSQGSYVALSRTHDLVSGNWLSSAFDACSKSKAQTVFHPATIVSFGERTFLYIMPDQANPDFSTDVLFSRNPWPGPSFASADLFAAHGTREPDQSKGFGQADWLWVCDTVAGGVVHKPVAETFSCCHRRWGHACVALEPEASLLMPTTKLFQSMSSRLPI